MQISFLHIFTDLYIFNLVLKKSAHLHATTFLYVLVNIVMFRMVLQCECACMCFLKNHSETNNFIYMCNYPEFNILNQLILENNELTQNSYVILHFCCFIVYEQIKKNYLKILISFKVMIFFSTHIFIALKYLLQSFLSQSCHMLSSGAVTFFLINIESNFLLFLLV